MSNIVEVLREAEEHTKAAEVKIDIYEVIDYLQGTWRSLDEAIEDCYPGKDSIDLTDEDFMAIDNTLFLCEQCGWWCEVGDYAEDEDGEIVGENICRDCGEN